MEEEQKYTNPFDQLPTLQDVLRATANQEQAEALLENHGQLIIHAGDDELAALELRFARGEESKRLVEDTIFQYYLRSSSSSPLKQTYHWAIPKEESLLQYISVKTREELPAQRPSIEYEEDTETLQHNSTQYLDGIDTNILDEWLAEDEVIYVEATDGEVVPGIALVFTRDAHQGNEVDDESNIEKIKEILGLYLRSKEANDSKVVWDILPPEGDYPYHTLLYRELV